MARRPPRRTRKSYLRGNWITAGPPQTLESLHDRMKELWADIRFGGREIDVYFAFHLRYNPKAETARKVHDEFFARHKAVLKRLGVTQRIYFDREDEGHVDVRPDIDAKKFGSTEEDIVRFFKRFCRTLGLHPMLYLTIERTFDVRVRKNDKLEWVNEGSWMLGQV